MDEVLPMWIVVPAIGALTALVFAIVEPKCNTWRDMVTATCTCMLTASIGSALAYLCGAQNIICGMLSPLFALAAYLVTPLISRKLYPKLKTNDMPARALLMNRISDSRSVDVAAYIIFGLFFTAPFADWLSRAVFHIDIVPSGVRGNFVLAVCAAYIAVAVFWRIGRNSNTTIVLNPDAEL